MQTAAFRWICLGLCSWAATIAPTYAAQETGFLNRTVEVDGAKYRYQVYVPAEWTANTKWPVILALLGAGERGDDGLVQTEVGLGGAIRRHVDRFPAVVVLPAMEAQALAALDRTMQEFNGDSDRVSLTGLSMGGGQVSGAVRCNRPRVRWHSAASKTRRSSTSAGGAGC